MMDPEINKRAGEVRAALPRDFVIGHGAWRREDTALYEPDAGRVIDLRDAEIARLKARVNAMRREFQLCASHEYECDYWEDGGCTCGLNELIGEPE